MAAGNEAVVSPLWQWHDAPDADPEAFRIVPGGTRPERRRTHDKNQMGITISSYDERIDLITCAQSFISNELYYTVLDIIS